MSVCVCLCLCVCVCVFVCDCVCVRDYYIYTYIHVIYIYTKSCSWYSCSGYTATVDIAVVDAWYESLKWYRQQCNSGSIIPSVTDYSFLAVSGSTINPIWIFSVSRAYAQGVRAVFEADLPGIHFSRNGVSVFIPFIKSWLWGGWANVPKWLVPCSPSVSTRGEAVHYVHVYAYDSILREYRIAEWEDLESLGDRVQRIVSQLFLQYPTIPYRADQWGAV